MDIAYLLEGSSKKLKKQKRRLKEREEIKLSSIQRKRPFVGVGINNGPNKNSPGEEEDGKKEKKKGNGKE